MRGGRKPKGERKKRSVVFTSLVEGYRPLRLVQTGIVALDAVLGGGIPRGHFVEVFGPSRGGKTALAYEVTRAFQQAGGPARDRRALLAAGARPDAKGRVRDSRGHWTVVGEHFDIEVFKRVGGDVDLLDYLYGANTVEDYFEGVAEPWIEQHAEDDVPKILTLDSVAMLGTKHEMETPMDKRDMNRAGQIFRGFRRVAGAMSTSGTTALFINQVREKTGVFWGSPETTPGGRSPEFFATIRLRLSQGTLSRGKRALIKTAGQVTGHRIVVKVDKNRLTPAEGRAVELEWHFLTGFDATAGTLRLLADSGLVRETSARKSEGELEGSETFEYGGRRIESEEAFVDEHPELLREIWRRFRPENVPASERAGG